MKLGVTAVPINPILNAEEIKYILHSSKSEAVLVGAQYLEKNAFLKEIPLRCLLVLEAGKGISRNGSFLPLADVLSKPGPQSSYESEDGDTVAIMYTSGTTAYPKGVEISYQRVIGNGLLFSRSLGLNAENRFYGILSMAYMGGWYNLMLIPFLNGSSLVISDTFDAGSALQFWNNVEKHGINTLWLVPTIMSIIMSLDRGEKGRQLGREQIKMGMVGTAPLPDKLKTSFEERYGFYLNENYGLSETFFISTNSFRHAKKGTVGKVLEGVEVKVIKDGESRFLTEDEGEIAVKTPYLMKGYYGETEGDQLLDGEGYFPTGDIGYLDPEGYLHLTGRKKDLIIRGGINISPKSVENAISGNEVVLESAAIGIPHEAYGEEVIAFVKIKDALSGKIKEKDILDYCREKLPEFKCPKRIIFIDEMPKSVTGKIQKAKLKVLYEEYVK
jgi:long-chain acyl-CoA synthetase